MAFETPEDAMPWVGLYVAIASLVCILAMAADAFRGFWRGKHWFPNKYFTLNAASLTLIAIAMKLPVDLNSNGTLNSVKVISTLFLFVMLANFLPSLGLMNDSELLVNMVALAIMMITINVNLWIQTVTLVVYASPQLLFMLIFPPLWVLSVALTVPASRRNLEHQYKRLHINSQKELQRLHIRSSNSQEELQRLHIRSSNSQEELQILSSNGHVPNFSTEELESNVKKYWMMAETGNPQFAVASSEVASAFGVVCSILVLSSILLLINIFVDPSYDFWSGQSDYKWSVKLIVTVQLVGVVVGSIAPILRCFTSIGYFDVSKKRSTNHLNVFRVGKCWIQTLRSWKRDHVSSHIPGRYGKIVAHFFRNITLNFCIALQVMIVVMCKIICLVPRFLLILFSVCWYIFKSLWKRLRFEPSVSEQNMREEMKKYKGYALQIEDEAKLTNRILRNTLNSITRLLQASEKKSPRNLMKFLQNSKGFIGVVEFDNKEVPPLISEVTKNSWSLVVVTLTAIAIALPGVANVHVKELLLSMFEGLYFVRHVEENLNVGEELVNLRKASQRVGIEVEVYRTWLQIDLKKARKGKTSKEILQWLGNEAVKIVKQYKEYESSSPDHSFHKFVAANCMYRISQTLLLHYDGQQNSPTDEEVIARVKSLIADILLACFTNLPRAIQMKCHHDTIEKRQDSIRTAAQILGKSKKILDILDARELPRIDMDSMAYVDKWRALSENQLQSKSDVASSKESVRVTIM